MRSPPVLIAKAWQPVYCPNNHIVALTIRDVYRHEVARTSSYVGIDGTVVPLTVLANICRLSCSKCDCADAMWFTNMGYYTIRTNKDEEHGRE